MIGSTPPMSALGQPDGQAGDLAYQMALDDFRKARRRSTVAHLLGRLTGKSLELLSFQEVTQRLKQAGQHELGLQEIPVRAIVGSVGRVADFDRDFFPLHEQDAQRWARVKAAGMERGTLPPINVYKIGESYFVLDGNHRVSIARQQGVETISALVVEVSTRAPLPADAKPDDLIIGAEHADFLERTELDKARPEADVHVSFPGQYKKLESHIAVHRCYLEANGAQTCRTVPEAARYWYDEAYLPVIEAIRERAILREFPGWTEADLYLWITENQEKLRDELGWSLKPSSVLGNLASEIGRGTWSLNIPRPKNVLSILKPHSREGGAGQKKWMQQRFLNRYSQYLFTDILVPVGSDFGLTPGAQRSLDQALVVALREGGDQAGDDQERAQLLGLAIIERERPADDVAVQAVREKFERRCREAGVDGALAVEEGNAADQISKRAIMADLIVLDRRFLSANRNREKGAIDMLRSLRQGDRPVLLTRKWTSPLKRILLASEEEAGIGTTLFSATYLAERWGSELVLLSSTKMGEREGGESGKVQQYLAMHEVEARFLTTDELEATAIADTADAQDCDLIVMNWPATGRIIGRASGDLIELVLDNCRQPILICP